MDLIYGFCVEAQRSMLSSVIVVDSYVSKLSVPLERDNFTTCQGSHQGGVDPIIHIIQSS